MKREWIGDYQLHYQEFHSYKNEWIGRSVSLGYCMGNDDAINKAISFLNNQDYQCKPLYIRDGWGNNIKA